MINKKKTIILLALLLSMLIIISALTVLVNASQNRKENIKNYGLCVANSTQEKNSCYKIAREEFKECAKEARNISIKNKTLAKENLFICKTNFKENKDKCKTDFKKSKEECLVYKNNSSGDINSIDRKNKPEKKCEEYTYSNCPEKCGKICLPSSCTKDPNLLNTICTDDCEGAGSCYTIPEKKCDEKLIDVRKELDSIQKCVSDSDCIIKGLNLPCIVSQCESAFNKNSDLSKLKELSEDYKKQCQEICPMYPCAISADPTNQKPVCINNKCQITDETNDEKNYCTPEQREVKACIDLYEPVCGWFDYNKILCISYPCTGSIISQEFSNSCYACANKDVLFWTKGKCPEKIKTSDISEKPKETGPVCGNGVCETNEVAYPTGAPHLYYCPQDCK